MRWWFAWKLRICYWFGVGEGEGEGDCVGEEERGQEGDELGGKFQEASS